VLAAATEVAVVTAAATEELQSAQVSEADELEESVTVVV